MDARRAQDILRHIINDEDNGAAMMEKLSVAESVHVIQKILPECIKAANERGSANDSGYFGEMYDRYKPVVLEKLKNAQHLWVVYSDNTGYPYIIDGDMIVLYNYVNHKEIERSLNALGYNVSLSCVDSLGFKNEIAHMYRNGYSKVRFMDGEAEPLEVEKEELYQYEEFFNEDYIINPALQKTMISYFQELRVKGAAESTDTTRQTLLKKREDEMIKAMLNAEYMVPCVKEETEEQIEISHHFIDMTDKVSDKKEGEQVIAIPVFTDGFEMNKCYEGQYENMLYQYNELVEMIDELGASGVIINVLGESYYMKKELMHRIG